MKPPNNSVETNRRPARPFDTGRHFESASCAPPYISAAVAHLSRWANMRAAVPFLLLSLLLTGCDPFTFKNVSLNLQPQTARNVVLTTNDLPVHEAMNLIDTTIVSNGFARDPSPIAPEDQARGVVAFYGICTVTLSSNRLDVAFLQRYSRHFSAPARKAIEQLKDKLSSRYGKENITVQN